MSTVKNFVLTKNKCEYRVDGCTHSCIVEDMNNATNTAKPLFIERRATDESWVVLNVIGQTQWAVLRFIPAGMGGYKLDSCRVEQNSEDWPDHTQEEIQGWMLQWWDRAELPKDVGVAARTAAKYCPEVA